MFCAAHQVTVMASLWSTCILFCSVGSLVLPETTENEGGKKVSPNLHDCMMIFKRGALTAWLKKGRIVYHAVLI